MDDFRKYATKHLGMNSLVFFFVSLYPYKLKNRKKWMILENTLPSILV